MLANWGGRAILCCSASLFLSAPVSSQEIVSVGPGAAQSQPAERETRQLQLPAVEVIGSEETLQKLQGSGFLLDQEELYRSHVFTTNEALRKVPGVNVRDEEGFGLRPNIGIRGINPTRSTKTLLLEDGLPLAYAPYGDNASYYHPPVDRFERIEVIKGASQILFGPQTITGAINYVTPTPPRAPGGFARFTGGNRDYYNGHFNYGGTWNNLGGLFDFIHKQGDGARDNTHHEINDVNLKGVYEIGPRSALILRGNNFTEDSQVTYSGITDAERANFGYRYNPFKNDEFETNRWGASATHEFTINGDASLTTSVYWSGFNREWWRQSSTTTDGQCGAAFRNDRLNGVAVDPDTCNSVQGRLRNYYAYGIEPRFEINHDTFVVPSELDFGFHLHSEHQHRKQINGAAPTARTGVLVERNEREVHAFAAYVQNRFLLGKWTVAPGVRLEDVDMDRENLLAGVRGENEVREPIPALGITYSPVEATTFFFGVHRGFAPPRVEDAISNATGNTVDVSAEKSWNYELGVRSKPSRGLRLDATLFRNDFENQIVVGSVAAGSPPLSEGETLYQGAELYARADLGDIFGSPHNVYLQSAWTWVADAEQESAFRCLPVDGVIPAACAGGIVPGSAEGNRVPYAPEHLLTAAVGYQHPVGLDVQLEAVFVDDQFSDFANLQNGTDHPNGPGSVEARSGQFGEIDSHVVLNLAGTYQVVRGLDLFVAVKNLLDRDYIVDRTRGILPGSPRLIQAGLSYSF
jgi:Fe(3+) dicitrate transport protein